MWNVDCHERPGSIRYVAGFGFVMMITLQAMVNIGVTTSLLPIRNATPFISFGGSNLAVCYFMVGVLVNIHRFGNPLLEWPRRCAESEHLPAMKPFRAVRLRHRWSPLSRTRRGGNPQGTRARGSTDRLGEGNRHRRPQGASRLSRGKASLRGHAERSFASLRAIPPPLVGGLRLLPGHLSKVPAVRYSGHGRLHLDGAHPRRASLEAADADSRIEIRAGDAKEDRRSLGTRVLRAFSSMSSVLQSIDCVVTGTPVRRNHNLAGPKGRARGVPSRRGSAHLIDHGWKPGAAGINQALFKCAPMLKDQPLQIIHLTGAGRSTGRRELPAGKYPHYVAPFHHRMEDAYSAADLVISRAGAASLVSFPNSDSPAFSSPTRMRPMITKPRMQRSSWKPAPRKCKPNGR